MAKLLAWKDEYCVGDDVIDKEHRNLFDMANEVFKIENPQQQIDNIRLLLYKLYDYMKYHFEHEETLMSEIHFEEIEYHKTRHSEIISEINNIMKSSHQITLLPEKLTAMMLKWVLKHILEEDFKMKSAINFLQQDLKQRNEQAELINGGIGIQSVTASV
jgi:hemerythrin